MVGEKKKRSYQENEHVCRDTRTWWETGINLIKSGRADVKKKEKNLLPLQLLLSAHFFLESSGQAIVSTWIPLHLKGL